MPQPETWPADCRIIEIDPESGALGDALVRAGHRGYLGVTHSEGRRRAIVDQFPKLSGAVIAARTPQLVRQNNAELLILSGSSALHLWSYRNVRHANYVAWKPSLNPVSLLAMLGWLIRFVVGRQYRKPFRLRCGKSSRSTGYLVSQVARPRRTCHTQRHFIPHRLGLKGLIAKFHQEQFDYLVLRWFEKLPECEPSGDIDLLVADEHIDRVLELLYSGPAVRPCDLYTPTGLPQTSYQAVSYYPAEVARRMLKNARLHRGFCRVPSALDYFHSLAYHAVYHKGRKSNLPGAEKYRTAKRSSHDFKTLLGNMANELGIEVEISLGGLHAYLQEQGWSPPPDWIARLATSAPHDRWLAELAASHGALPTMDRRFTVFVIRQSAVDEGVHERVISMIEDHGFVTLARKTLTPQEIEYGAPRTRGGNWGLGPKDHVGGMPAIIVAAYDPQPLRSTRAQRKRYPHVVNARNFVKEDIRRQINREIAPRHPINGLHSSDYGGEAHHFLHTFAPELVEVVQEKIDVLRGRSEPRRMAA
jgi:hypothetical protein